jgi:large subunit ribosomal protein L25
MKQTLTLAVNMRPADENVKTLRRSGDVPGVIYGSKMKSTSIKCKVKDLHNVYMKAGENTLVEVEMDGKKIPTLIHSLAYEPVSGAYEHVDLYAVDMTKKVTTRVPVSFEGVAPAVKELGGILVTVHGEITVQCLPADIPEKFVVDLSSLAQFRDSITVGKITMPKGVVAQDNAETVVVTVQEPRKEEVIEPVVTATAEGAVGADGAAAPAAAGAAAAPAAAGGDKKDAKPAAGGKDKK